MHGGTSQHGGPLAFWPDPSVGANRMSSTRPTASACASGRPELAAIREYMIVNGKPLRQGAGRSHRRTTWPTWCHRHSGYAGPAQIDLAVQAARRAFASGPWHDMLPAGRERLLLNLADLGGAPRRGTGAARNPEQRQAAGRGPGAGGRPGAQWLRYMAGWATKLTGDTLALSILFLPGVKYSAYTLPQPVGVVAAIIPWNFPLLMAIWKIAPALAAGCTVVSPPRKRC